MRSQGVDFFSRDNHHQDSTSRKEIPQGTGFFGGPGFFQSGGFQNAYIFSVLLVSVTYSTFLRAQNYCMKLIHKRTG